MAVPVMFIAIPLIAGGAGMTGKGLWDWWSAESDFEQAEEEFSRALHGLAELRAEVEDERSHLARYRNRVYRDLVELFAADMRAAGRNLQFDPCEPVGALPDQVVIQTPDSTDTLDMADILSGIRRAFRAGSVTQQAVLLTTTLLAKAGTGVPIRALSGAAAEKAALASLGGGPIASGGGGIAAGSAGLTAIGIAAGALVIGGVALVIGSRAKTSAAEYRAQVDVALAQLKLESRRLTRYRHVIKQCDQQTGELVHLTRTVQAELRHARSSNAPDIKRFERNAIKATGALAHLCSRPLFSRV